MLNTLFELFNLIAPYSAGELSHPDTGLFPLVEGRLDIGKEQAVPVINRTFDYLYEHFDEPRLATILDSSPGTACPVVEYCGSSFESRLSEFRHHVTQRLIREEN